MTGIKHFFCNYIFLISSIDKDERVETFCQFLPSLEKDFEEQAKQVDDNGIATNDGKKYPKDILELYMKLMKCTDCSMN